MNSQPGVNDAKNNRSRTMESHDGVHADTDGDHGWTFVSQRVGMKGGIAGCLYPVMVIGRQLCPESMYVGHKKKCPCTTSEEGSIIDNYPDIRTQAVGCQSWPSSLVCFVGLFPCSLAFGKQAKTAGNVTTGVCMMASVMGCFVPGHLVCLLRCSYLVPRRRTFCL